MALQQTSTWVDVKFSTLMKILAEKQKATEIFIEEQQVAAINEAELRLTQLEENCKILRKNKECIAAVHNLSDTELIKVQTPVCHLVTFLGGTIQKMSGP